MLENFILKANANGSLEECLNLYSVANLEQIAIFYGKGKEFKTRTKLGRVKYIAYTIKEQMHDIIESFNYQTLKILNLLVNGKSMTIKNIPEELLLTGFVFITDDDYFVPNDIIEPLKEKVSAFLLEINVRSVLFYISKLFYVNGPMEYDKFINEYKSVTESEVSIDVLKREIKERKFLKDDLIEIDGKTFYVDNLASNVPECKKTYQEHYFHFIEVNELDNYVNTLNQLGIDLEKVLEMNSEEAMQVIIEKVLLKTRKKEEIIDDIFNTYNLNMKKGLLLKRAFNDISKIYFWDTEYKEEI